MERPFGVTLLASFFFAQGAINVLILFGYYAEGAPTLPVAYYAVTSVAGLVMAVGLWKGYPWGRIGTMILSAWEIIIGVLGLFIALDIEPISPIQATTKIIVYGIVIYFMTRPEISDYFNR